MILQWYHLHSLLLPISYFFNYTLIESHTLAFVLFLVHILICSKEYFCHLITWNSLYLCISCSNAISSDSVPCSLYKILFPSLTLSLEFVAKIVISLSYFMVIYLLVDYHFTISAVKVLFPCTSVLLSYLSNINKHVVNAWTFHH